MTSSNFNIDPDLHDLLGDIGRQRESVLFKVMSTDVQKLVDQPDSEGIDKSIGRLSNAERHLLDSRRHEVSALLHEAIGRSWNRRPDLWSNVYLGPMTADRFLGESEWRARAAHPSIAEQGINSTVQALLSGADLDPASAVAVQSVAVKLAPTASRRTLLGYSLWHAGKSSAAGRLASRLCAEPDLGDSSSFAYEFAGMLASADFDVHEAGQLYRRAVGLGPERTGPRLEWLAQAIYFGDASEADHAIGSLLEMKCDKAVLASIAAARRAAQADSRWSLNPAALQLVERLRSHKNSTVAEVASALA